MSFFLIGIVSLLSGIMASLGLGGGMVLIIYLVIFEGAGQLFAQGVNLIFFIPIAILSIIIHTKNGLVEWKSIIPSIILGVILATVFALIADKIDSKMLSKLFAGFLILIGINQLIKGRKKSK